MRQAGGRRPVLLLLTHSFLIHCVTFLLRPAGSYAAIDLDVPAAALGAIGSTFAVAPLLLAVPLGAVVDRVGERALLVSGGLTVLGAGGCFLLTQGVWGLVAANALLGLGHLGCVLAQQSLVARSESGVGLDTAFGHLTFAASLGQAAGTALLGAIGGSSILLDADSVFRVAVGVALLLVLIAPLLGTSRPRAPTGEESGGTASLLKTRGLLPALFTSAVILSVVDLTLVYLPALGADRGLTTGAVGALLTIRALFSMLSRIGLGRLTARFGRGRIMVLSIGLASLTSGMLAVDLPFAGLVVLVALLGLGLGVGQPLTMSWLTEQAPAHLRGRALSLRLMGNRIGQLAFPSVAGLVAAGAGTSGVLVVTAAGLGATGVVVRRLRLDG